MGCGSSKKVATCETFCGEIAKDKKELKIEWHDSLRIVAAVCKMQGWRKTQEDMAVALTHYADNSDALLCGVFDGHSGGESSYFASANIFPSIIGTNAWRSGDREGAVIEGFMAVDRNLRKANTQDGTTAVCAIVTSDKILVANCGDSRAILCRAGEVVRLSIDHKPNNANEADRINRAGGFVEFYNSSCPRVMAPDCYLAMATSRTLGDFHFKSNPSRSQFEQIVSPCPTIVQTNRHASDQFIILASDGVWDVMSNEEVCDLLVAEAALIRAKPIVADISKGSEFVKSKSSSTSAAREHDVDAGHLAEILLARCFAKGTMDNCSVIIVDLRTQA